MKTTCNKYSSIVPSEMSNNELRHMCTELQTAKNWGVKSARVFITSTGREYDVPVANIEDYRRQFKTVTL